MKVPSDLLNDLYKTNHGIIHMQVKDVTQAESLVQPPFQGNCMNWVVGHILDERCGALTLLGLPGVMSEIETKKYCYGSEPMTDVARASDLNSMIKRLDESFKALTNKLGSVTPEELDAPTQSWRGTITKGEALYFMLWHEAYHTGQLELLRQLAGKNDKII
jgi:hypothetical protein